MTRADERALGAQSNAALDLVVDLEPEFIEAERVRSSVQAELALGSGLGSYGHANPDAAFITTHFARPLVQVADPL